MALVVFTYIYWHYTNALTTLFGHIGNLLAFLWRFFGIPTLLKTLFSPWRRLHESYEKGFMNIKDALATFVINTLMRLVGAAVRLAVIAFGLGVLIMAVAVSLATLLVWLLFPAVCGILIAIIVRIIV